MCSGLQCSLPVLKRLAPLLWIASLAVGIAGSAGVQPPLALIVSGALFGLGFVTAGALELRA
jgi:hypothetical protein